MKPDILTALEDASKLLDESVHHHNMVVRWDNGDLEGFSGTAFSSAKKAKESAEGKAIRKSKFIKKNYTILGAKDFAQLSSAEKKRLKRDWELSGRMDESKGFEKEKLKEKSSLELAQMIFNKEMSWNELEKAVGEDNPMLDRIGDMVSRMELGKEADIGDVDESSELKTESIEMDSKDVMKHDKEIAKELATVLSVFLFQVEKITGQEFEDANQAEDFIFAAYRMLRTRESGTLKAILRKFDRIGGENGYIIPPRVG